MDKFHRMQEAMKRRLTMEERSVLVCSAPASQSDENQIPDTNFSTMAVGDNEKLTRVMVKHGYLLTKMKRTCCQFAQIRRQHRMLNLKMILSKK